jgi:hypothetical protein
MLLNYLMSGSQHRCYNTVTKPIIQPKTMKNNYFASALIFGLISFTYEMPSLAEQACIRSPNGKIICGEVVKKESTSNSKPSNNKVNTQSKMGLDFTLEGCKKARAGLYCSISVYNSSDFDKRLSWTTWPHNILIDSESRQYATEVVKMGNVYAHSTATLPPKATINEGDNGVRLTFHDFNIS